MNKKPIDVLNEQINVYKKFIASVESEKNIEVSKEQVEKIICDARLKITEFEDAVKILSGETRKDFEKEVCQHHFIGNRMPNTKRYELVCEFCGEPKANFSKSVFRP